jgi:hypothetical protein
MATALFKDVIAAHWTQLNLSNLIQVKYAIQRYATCSQIKQLVKHDHPIAEAS